MTLKEILGADIKETKNPADVILKIRCHCLFDRKEYPCTTECVKEKMDIKCFKCYFFDCEVIKEV